MLAIGPREMDGISGRIYREFNGVRFWYWPKRGFYVSQRGGKQLMLHREAFGCIDKLFEVYPINGDWENFETSNWAQRRKNEGRNVRSLHEFQQFDGLKFYRRPDNGYYARKYPCAVLMHRYVWEFHHGPIPAGYHVHHIDHDRSNNRIENLDLLSASEHTSMHSSESAWVGSAANKRQLTEAAKKAVEWHRSEQGRAWHREHARKCMGARPKHRKTCEECGVEYETIWPHKSKFCNAGCKRRAYKRRTNAGLRSDCGA